MRNPLEGAVSGPLAGMLLFTQSYQPITVIALQIVGRGEPDRHEGGRHLVGDRHPGLADVDSRVRNWMSGVAVDCLIQNCAA